MQQRIIFERGIEIARDADGGWSFQNTMKREVSVIPWPDGIAAKLGLRPVVHLYEAGIEHLYSVAGDRSLSFDVGDVEQADFPRVWSRKWDFIYVLGASVYHCCQLSKEYARVCSDYVTARGAVGAIANECELGFANRYEVYYEFDALLGAARRAFRDVGVLVWSRFGKRGRGCPPKFDKVISGCRQASGGSLPPPLADYLDECWGRTGKTLKDYRDCMSHFAQFSRGKARVVLRPVADGLISVFVPIPVNPEVKSKKKLIYEPELDALSYAWTAVDEILAMSRRVVQAVESVKPEKEYMPV